VLFFGKFYEIEVHFYSIHKAGFEWPEQMLINIEEASHLIETANLPLKRIKEDQNLYALGYAKQTLKYTESVCADAICIMSIPSEEYYYFAQSDKESLLLNEKCLPVLCAGGSCGC